MGSSNANMGSSSSQHESLVDIYEHQKRGSKEKRSNITPLYQLAAYYIAKSHLKKVGMGYSK